MAITGTFLADFTKFVASTADAADSLSTLQGASSETEKALASMSDNGAADAKRLGDAYDAAAVEATKTLQDQLAPAIENVQARWSDFVGAAEKAGRAAVDFGKQAVSSYAESEAGQVRLRTALEGTGNASDAVIAQYDAMALSFQDMTKYSDDAITAAQATLTTIGHVAPEQMQPAIQAAVDLATQLKIELPAAATMLGKVLGSDGANLGKLKAVLGDNIEKGAGADDVLKAIAKTMGGAAAAEGKTFEGQMARVANQVDNTREAVGKTVTEAMSPLLQTFLDLPEPIQSALLVMKEMGPSILPLLGTLGSLVTAVTGVIGIIGAAGLGAALLAILPWIAAVVAAVTAGIAIWKNWDAIVAFVQNAWTAVGNVFTAAKDAIVSIAKGIYDGVYQWIVSGFTAIVDGVKIAMGPLVGAFQWAADLIVHHSIVPDMIDAIGEQYSRLNDLMVGPADAANAGVANSFAAAAAALHEHEQYVKDLRAQYAAAGIIQHDYMVSGLVPKITAADFMARAGSVSPVPMGGGGSQVNVNMNGVLVGTDPSARQQLMDLISSTVVDTLKNQGVRLGYAGSTT